MLRIGAAFGAEFLGGNLVLVELLLAVLLFDLPFDWKAMAIPAGHIGRVLAQQVLRSADHVFEDMVERMADMHIAVGIGRAVMQDELFCTAARFAQAAVKPFGFPARQNARLLLREAGLHGEIGLRQEDGVPEISLGFVALF